MTTTSDGPRQGEPSTTRRALVEDELLRHAAALFAEKGFGATSLEDIAAQVGMKRPSLYHYFRSKDDLLAKIVTNVAERGPAAVVEAASGAGDPPQKLRAIAYALTLEVARSTSEFRLVLTTEANLPSELAHRVRESKRLVTMQITEVVAEGIHRGDFVPVDARLAALAILGMCNWTAWWFSPGPSKPIEPVADSIADQALRSVMQVDGHHPPHGGDPRVVLRSLRANVDTLAKMLRDATP